MSNAMDPHAHAFLHLLCLATHTKTHEMQTHSESRYYSVNMYMNNTYWKRDQTFTGLNKHVNQMLTINHVSR